MSKTAGGVLASVCVVSPRRCGSEPADGGRETEWVPPSGLGERAWPESRGKSVALGRRHLRAGSRRRKPSASPADRLVPPAGCRVRRRIPASTDVLRGGVAPSAVSATREADCPPRVAAKAKRQPACTPRADQRRYSGCAPRSLWPRGCRPRWSASWQSRWCR
jgi:hypothetical protein